MGSRYTMCKKQDGKKYVSSAIVILRENVCACVCFVCLRTYFLGLLILLKSLETVGSWQVEFRVVPNIWPPYLCCVEFPPVCTGLEDRKQPCHIVNQRRTGHMARAQGWPKPAASKTTGTSAL